MNGPLLMMQIEQSMTHPVMQQRRRLYQGIEQLFVQVIEPVAAYGLMLRDCQGHPIVGPLEQMVREAVLVMMVCYRSYRPSRAIRSCIN